MDWFEKLTVFKETGYDDTCARLAVAGDRLYSKANEKSYAIGKLETPSVKELRSRAQAAIGERAGKPSVSSVSGDVRTMHADPANANALFQVASQFNLLEMVGPDITPEDGVTRYMADRTQGPACAMAAGAATIYRNYFADVAGHSGQTRRRQIDCLSDLGAALGNDGDALWTMRNGYAMCSEPGLAKIDRRLASATGAEIDALRDLLRIGLHWNVEVTDAPDPRPRVSQAFCSALPVRYEPTIPARQWQSFATLVLEGAYEATMWAAVLNAMQSSSNVVLLTLLGGGAFGNEKSWILGALARSLALVEKVGLNVRVVSYGAAPAELEKLVRR